MTLALTGHAGSSGIAIGLTHRVEHNELEIGEHRISTDGVAEEIQRLGRAIDQSVEQLNHIADSISDDLAQPAGEIIQTHIHLLQDPGLSAATGNTIQTELCNAEWALQLYLEKLLEDFRHLEDEYIRARGEDVRQVVHLVQSKLGENGLETRMDTVPDRLADTLVVATELTPGELAVLHQRGVAGVITEHGSPHSHTSILANSLQIPGVFGVRLAHELLSEGEILVLDGHLGIVYADPHDSILQHYEQVRRDSTRYRKSLREIQDLPSISLDGQVISQHANAERDEDLKSAVRARVDGVGLFRTEFLYLQAEPPDEEMQLSHYLQAMEALGGLPLTIRTLDLGADKHVGSSFSSPHNAQNPALGLRAIRLCLRDSELFGIQLRAILRASAQGPVRCLIPMLTSVKEIDLVRALLEESRRILASRGLSFDAEMPLGGMIEVPAAAFALEELAAQLDFLSVGTNDLLQYALAADRVDEDVAHLYDPQHPGVVRILQHIFSTAQRLQISVAVCGEMAGDSRYTRLLLALGLREFSMHPGHLLEVKQVIRKTDIPRATAALTKWLNRTPGTTDASQGVSLVQAIDQSQ